MFIYLITNTINGKQYVGQTVKTLRRRFTLHANNGRSNALSKAMNKYGREVFKIELLQVCDDHVSMDHAERDWISRLNTLSPNGYNLHSGGRGRGKTVSEETRAKLRRAWLRRGPRTLKSRKQQSDTIKRQMREDPAFREQRAGYLVKSYGHRKGARAPNGKAILCITTGEIFRTAMDAAKKYGLCNSTVGQVANGRWKATKNYKFKWI